MNTVHQDAIQEKRQLLIEKLINSGIFKINDKHLYEWGLHELEKEYQELLDCQMAEVQYLECEVNQVS